MAKMPERRETGHEGSSSAPESTDQTNGRKPRLKYFRMNDDIPVRRSQRRKRNDASVVGGWFDFV